MALGNGSIICSGKDCGLANNEDGRNGYGIAISYNDCACIVYYLHLKTVEDLQTGSVTGGQLVGTSGSSASGHEHLHLEVRPYLGAATYYNPLFFFTSNALTTANLSFTSYRNHYNEWSYYGYSSKEGNRFGYYWKGTLPSYQTK